MGSLTRRLIAGLLALSACEPSDDPPSSRPLSGESEQLLAVEELERGVRGVQANAADIEQEFARAKQLYEEAKVKWDAARRLTEASETSIGSAIESFEAAEKKWKYYQVLIEVAAAVDANNLDKFRASTGVKNVRSLNCDAGMSTAAFRRQLTLDGVNIEGMDVDHIVPRSLGGADHPANYQLLSSSVNRSIGNRWDAAKCLATRGQCAGAVAISRRCGNFSGTGF